MGFPTSLDEILTCPEGKTEEEWALSLAEIVFVTGEKVYVEKLTSDTKAVLKDCGFSISSGFSMAGMQFVENPESNGPFDKYVRKENNSVNFIYYDIIDYNEYNI